MTTNWIDARTHGWGFSFGLLQSAGLIPAPLPPVIEPPAPSKSALEQHIERQQAYATVVVGNDEMGHDYTEADLDAMPAKDALRLRRLFEKGHRGNTQLDQVLEVRDAQAARDVELAKRVLAEQ